jgi:hypothetical protein
MEKIGDILERIMTKKFNMTRIECGWCKKTVGFKNMDVPEGLEDKPTSTICEACLRKEFPEYAEEIIQKARKEKKNDD